MQVFSKELGLDLLNKEAKSFLSSDFDNSKRNINLLKLIIKFQTKFMKFFNYANYPHVVF